MADIYDVETALTNLAQSAIYPNGLSLPSVAGCAVKIYPGWPIPASLDVDLSAGNANVSIFPSNIARPTTRFQTEWYTTALSAPTLVLTVSGLTITISGTVATSQACVALVNGTGYAYGVLITDTLTTIATNLAALIPGATSSGAVITLSATTHTVICRVVVSGTTTREVARELRMMLLTVWAPTPIIRSQIGSALISLFSATYRVALPDGFYAQLKYTGFNEQDILETVLCYRRSIHFTVEYAITQAQNTYTISDNVIDITSAISGSTVLPSP